MNLNVSLLPWQRDVWEDEKRFKVIAAGRRTGKTRLAVLWLLFKALTTPRGHVFYIAPTQQQARDIVWDQIFELGHELIVGHHKNNMTISLVGGRTISLKGADNPDTMRGVSLAACVLDEYAFMKPEVWEMIIRPALSDLEGEAIFIGTPAGRNHFFDLYTTADLEDSEGWAAYHYTSYDNPHISREELEIARKQLSAFAFAQEYMASFQARNSEIFTESMIQIATREPKGGEYYIAADLAGFEMPKASQRAKKSRLDNTAISAVRVSPDGKWWVDEILAGRWSARETADKLFQMHRRYRPRAFGIERGIAAQAVLEPLKEMQRERGYFFDVHMLTHGNQRKVDRVLWALEPLFEKKKITLRQADWNIPFLDELFQFPDPLTKDDMPDSLSYIAQLVKTNVATADDLDYSYEPLDAYAGY